MKTAKISSFSRLLVVLLMLVCIAGSVWADNMVLDSDVLFYASFDNGSDFTMNADASLTDGSILGHGNAQSSTNGRTGKGYLSGGEGIQLWYDALSNVNLDAGTVCMWVFDNNWYGDYEDPWNRYFFRLNEGHAGYDSLRLIKYNYLSPHMAPSRYGPGPRSDATSLVHAEVARNTRNAAEGKTLL